MREPWESSKPENEWSDPEAWRGERPPETPDDWRPDAGAGWVWAGDDEPEAEDQEVTPGWPEDLAGPEYWMYRRFDC